MKIEKKANMTDDSNCDEIQSDNLSKIQLISELKEIKEIELRILKFQQEIYDVISETIDKIQNYNLELKLQLILQFEKIKEIEIKILKCLQKINYGIIEGTMSTSDQFIKYIRYQWDGRK